MKLTVCTFLLFVCTSIFYAQSKNMEAPYAQIPEYPNDYTSENVAARMIDGLGYRFHWASKDLRAEDVAYKPEGENTKTVDETLDHLLGLSKTIRNTCFNLPSVRPYVEVDFTYIEKRKMILQNLYEASEELKKNSKSLSDLDVVFQRGEKSSAFPFWNLINGQIADAIYHTGQLVSYRRSSGNPLDPMVNVFIGKNREPKK